MHVFDGNTHNLQTRTTYNVSMTSSVADYLTFALVKYLFPLKIPWKLDGNLNIFHEDTKQNVSGCFFEHGVYLTLHIFP